MNKQEIEKAIETLKKYHDLLLEVYADYSVYSKAENYSDKSLELASRANTVKNAVGTAITHMSQQLNNGWISVSESLPEENIDGITDDFLPYNVSLKFKYGECVRTYQFGQGRWWKNGDDMTAYVIAWQPLPPKYKEVSE